MWPSAIACGEGHGGSKVEVWATRYEAARAERPSGERLAADRLNSDPGSVVEVQSARRSVRGLGMPEANRTEVRGAGRDRTSATLEANSEIAYKAMFTTHGVAAIKWPIEAAEAILSESDRRRERFSAFAFSFRYDVR